MNEMLGVLGSISVLAEAGPLLPVYVITLIVGGGMIFISTVFGGHGDTVDVDLGGDVDFDLDADTDLDGFDGDMNVDVAAQGLETDHGHGAGDLALSQWFSIRFFVYFLAMFGLVGTTLSWLSSWPVWMVFASAIGSGLVVGQVVHQTMRVITRNSGNSQLTSQDFVNRLGRVTAMVGGEQPGEVALSIRGGERYVTARTRHSEDQFKPGDSVGVVSFRGGVAEVVSKKEFDFLLDRAGRKRD